ncbi:MAG: cytochrome c-type biogenesis protein CcmF [Candidatus Poriferisodalaceae bacterium]
MSAFVGTIGIALALVGALGGALTMAAALFQRQPEKQRQALVWVAMMVVGVVSAVVAMEVALLSDNFSLAYVADNSTRSTPTVYKMATLWGALEGSILLWGFVLVGYVSAAVWTFRKRLDDRLMGFATLTMFVVCAFFFFLLAGPSDPFGTLAVAPADGAGLNPLLRNHPLMAIHPLMLYLGYVGFTVPFAFAIAALATGRLGEGWLTATRTWTMIAWGCLSIGIILGAWWSYEVLGWGGYWAWDPVENASFLPWLTGTAYIHSVMVQERRGMLRVWNLSLLLATFALTIFGTFLTRSGVIESVHAFAEGSVGPLLLAFFTLVTGVSVALVWWRGDRLRSPGSVDSPISREGAFLANNLLFAAFAGIVLLGTVFPILVEAANGDQLAVGRPYFDRMLLPIGLALLFLMGLAPMLTWRSTSVDVMRQRVLVPAAVGVASMVLGLWFGAIGFFAIIGIGLGGFTMGGSLRHLVLAVRRQGWRGATGRAGGGMVAHIGVALIAFGFIASTAFGEEGEFVLSPGEQASVAGHTVTFLSLTDEEGPDSRVVKAVIDVEGRGTFEPAVTRFVTFGQPISTPSVATSLVDDVYLSFATIPDQGVDEIVIRVVIKPLIAWLWLGGLLIGVGTLLALIPPSRRARQGAVESAPGAYGKMPDAAKPETVTA